MDQLQEQIEKIIDEGEGARRSVIVEMATPSEAEDERLLKVAAEVNRRRNLSLTARDLLPAPQQELQELQEASDGAHVRTASARDILSSSKASLAVQVGAALLPIVAGRLINGGQQSLTVLLASALVQKALSETFEKKEKEHPSSISLQTAPALPTSGSMGLDIHKDDLSKLPNEVPQIQNVYPNRTLRAPNLAEVKNVPTRVQEEITSSWGVNKIGAMSVWGAYNARGRGVKVAVLDTGVDADHPDLKGKVTSWAEFDMDGYEVPESKPHDSGTHGTHCAGTIAGGNASGSWIGVAPEAELAAALVLKDGRGTELQLLAALDWAIRNNVDVISMSLGGVTWDAEPPNPYTRALSTALASGIPVITAIGNEGSQTTGSPGSDWLAFSVGATDPVDRPAGFSGGRTHIVRKSQYLAADSLPLVYSKPEVSAPGVAIRSSVPGEQWAAFNGTSMATPHVAGAAALLLSATRIRDRLAQAHRALLIQDLLAGSVEELGEAGQDHRYGFGRIDVLRAVGFAKEEGY